MNSSVKKAVIPAAGLGTRFLPATKAQPKEMLALVDKPAIQYVVEEAVAAGITDILIITGRGKRSLEDHFDRSFELEYHLEKGGKYEALAEMRAIADMADIHYVRQGEPNGLGHAVGVARGHVGNEPFAVMLGDDIMHERSGVLTDMLGAFDRHGRSVIALRQVPRSEISSYGCAAVEQEEGQLVRINDIVEKPSVEEAPSSLAVMGRYVFTPEIFDVIDKTQPGKGNEIQLTDAVKALLELQAVYGWTFVEGRFDIGNKLDYLRATVELALEREDVGPAFKAYLVARLRDELSGAGPGVIPLGEAQDRVLAGCAPGPTVDVALDDALGLVLAEDVVAAEQIPPFASSAMDGFAVRAADLVGAAETRPVRLRVVGTLAAGVAPTTAVGAGEAIRIMTGAPFPEGADSVAIVETSRPAGDDEVDILADVAAGANVRPAGEDITAGQPVFLAGTVLGPGHLGVLASLGRERVAAVAAPVVGVLSTGDELVDGAAPLGPGQIRDANRHTLVGLLRRDGFGVVDLGIARDVEADIRARLDDGCARCDAVITSGGVSMGDYDYIKKILDELGDMAWMQVAIRPAKPFAFGLVGTTPVFGLPGNPVSSMVSYELLARPGLRRLAGHAEPTLRRPSVRAVAADALRRPDDSRVTFVRVTAAVGPDGRATVRSAGGQASNLLWPMAVANALAVLPPGPGVAAGDEVDIVVLD